MNDDKRKRPLRGVEIRFGPPEPTRLPSSWDPPTPAWVKQLADELDERSKHAPAKRGRSKLRRKQQPEPKAKVKLKPVKHQMILAILTRLYPDGKFEHVGTTALRYRAGPYWDAECDEWGVTYTLPGLDTFDRALGRR
jgi:hypothetical protein